MISLGVSTNTLLNKYLVYSRDNSAENRDAGKDAMDHYHTFLYNEADNYVIERSKYGKTKENQRSYLLPPDYIKMKTVKFKAPGETTWNPLTEVKSVDEWNVRTAVPTTVRIPTHWIVINEQGNMHLELDGLPDEDATLKNLEIVYEGAQNRLLFPGDVSGGTITATLGQPNISGVGTAFTSGMVNRFIRPTDGKYFYEIKTVSNNLLMQINNYFQEATVSSSYVIAELPRLPSEFHYTILWGALMDYFLPSNAAQAAKYEKKYVRELLMLQNRYKSKTKGRVMPGIQVGSQISATPRNYPNRLITRIS